MNDQPGPPNGPGIARTGMAPGRVHVSAERIARRIDHLADLTDPERPYTRRAFSTHYGQAREWLTNEFQSSGLEVRLDAGGNLYGVRPGTDPSTSAWMLGSHIDTVPSGGRFDGVAGVVCAMEVADALAEAGVRLRHPLCVIDFLSEEPSDYGPSCVGSRAWAGTLTDAMLATTDASGETLAEAIARTGGDPDAIRRGPAAALDAAGYLELHIEQGRRLEQAEAPVGLVDGIVAVHRYAWRVSGEAAHAGTTRMAERRDALVGAAAVVAQAYERARAAEAANGSFVATIGRLSVTPNGINVVPGSVDLVLEIRALDEALLVTWYADLERDVRRDLERSGLTLATREVSTAPAMRSDGRLIDALRRSASAAGHEAPRLTSGAGHDAMQVARRAPVAMLFVPSRGGVSHTPNEATDLDDLVIGASVLEGAILDLDANA